MPAIAERAEWVRKDKAVEYVQIKGIDTFAIETLKHYAYRTDLLPKPKVVGRHAYWKISDLDKFVESL